MVAVLQPRCPCLWGAKYNKTEKYAEQECERIPLSKPKSFCGKEGFFCNRKSGVKNKEKSSKIGEVIGNYWPIEQNYLICMILFTSSTNI